MTATLPFRRAMLTVALVQLVATASPAVAEVYRYRDERGACRLRDSRPKHCR